MWTSKLGNKYARALIDELDSKHHKILKGLRKQPANARCAECGELDTTWASVNIGAFLCVRCADVHRALGTHISKVKGCSGTYLWGPDEIARMQEMGNAAVNEQYAGDSAGARPSSGASKDERLELCRKKYEQRVWVKPVASRSKPVDKAAVAQAERRAAQVTRSCLLDDLFADFDAPQEATEQARAGSTCLPSTGLRGAASDPSVLDLFDSFDTSQDATTSTQKAISTQQKGSLGPPGVNFAIADSDASRAARRPLPADVSWFDELFVARGAVAKKDTEGADSSTVASEEEWLSGSKVKQEVSVAPAPTFGAPHAAIAAAVPESLPPDTSIWNDFGAW